MSDATLGQACLPPALERTPVRAGMALRRRPGARFGKGWRRLKIRVLAFVDFVSEVRRSMDEGRQLHPTISAYRR